MEQETASAQGGGVKPVIPARWTIFKEIDWNPPPRDDDHAREIAEIPPREEPRKNKVERSLAKVNRSIEIAAGVLRSTACAGFTTRLLNSTFPPPPGRPPAMDELTRMLYQHQGLLPPDKGDDKEDPVATEYPTRVIRVERNARLLTREMLTAFLGQFCDVDIVRIHHISGRYPEVTWGNVEVYFRDIKMAKVCYKAFKSHNRYSATKCKYVLARETRRR